MLTVPQLLDKYSANVPRYTGYPTAPHFKPLSSEEYRQNLTSSDLSRPVSLYLHVPFCNELCLFCGCNTQIVHKEAPVLAYKDLLLKEIAMVSATLQGRASVSHIHWGGGTPTALGPDSLQEVNEALHHHFNILPEAEIAIEVDPRTLTPPRAAALTAIGMNRASLGVQDFNEKVQQTIGRVQSLSLTQKVAETLRKAGAKSLNLDLIYGLPYQTRDSFRKTITEALTINPDRIAVFGYAHVPWMKKQQNLIPDASLPDKYERFYARELSDRLLEEAGFIPVGLDHFSLPSDSLTEAFKTHKLRRNFQGYTTDNSPVLIGLGVSAIGYNTAGYAQNFSSLPPYREALEADLFPVFRGFLLSEEDKIRASLIEELMCYQMLDLAALVKNSPNPDLTTRILSEALPHLQSFADDFLIRQEGAKLYVLPTGKPFLRAVAAVFDAYFQHSPARHAQLV